MGMFLDVFCLLIPDNKSKHKPLMKSGAILYPSYASKTNPLPIYMVMFFVLSMLSSKAFTKTTISNLMKKKLSN